MLKETITIACPLCGDSHTYSLKIERSDTDYGQKSDKSVPQKQMKKITRLFTCPKMGEFFEKVIEIAEYSNSRIQKVTVKGILKEK